MTVIILDGAEAEIEEIFDFLEARRRGLGYKFLTELEEALDRIQASPRSFPKSYRRKRLCLMQRFKCGVFFEVGTSYVYINAVIDLRRNPRSIRRRLR